MVTTNLHKFCVFGNDAKVHGGVAARALHFTSSPPTFHFRLRVDIGRDITFDIKNTAFTLQPLEFGNGLSQSPNAAITPGFKYDPYTGTTVHVNNNTRDLAGIVKKGTDSSVLEVTTKVWGTNNTNDPNWRPVVRLKGSRYISLIEETPGVYAITLVN